MENLIYQRVCLKLDGGGNNIWDKNLEVIEYMVTDIHDGHVEILEIVNKLYLPI